MLRRIVWIGLAAAAALCAQAGIEGTWQGTLDAGAMKLRLGLHVTKNAAGELSSTLDSIDQRAMGIPAKVTFSGNALHLELASLNAKYDGTLSVDGKEIGGTFVQGATLPLIFKRVEKVETLKRPQDPKPPFPYDAQDVGYENKTSIKLAGTLTLPRGQGPFPAAIMITGSGPQDRDESLLGHKPFLVIADYLTRRGIAVLRVDDRGVGGSTGKSTETSIEEMADDVVTGVEFLKGRKEIDAKRIGVIGHSEGGLVGPAAAARSTDVAFVVMLAGTGVRGDDILRRQGEAVIRAGGGTDKAVKQQRFMQEMIFGIMKSEPDPKAAVAKMDAEWVKIKAQLPEGELKGLGVTDESIHAQFVGITSGEIRSFLFYDPAETLRKVKVPVLALNGSRDLQVLPEQNLPPITAALAAAGNTDFTVSELPGLNHLFQKCKQCTVTEYGELEETFSPTALEIMGDWIVRHTHAQ